MESYIAIIRKDLDSDYGIEFPDFPGCVSAGETVEEARRMGAEALGLHIAGMIEDGAAMPTPSTWAGLNPSGPEAEGGLFVLIDAPARPVRSMRVNVMLPKDLLQDIDRVSGNRSRFLADAARARLSGSAADVLFAGRETAEEAVIGVTARVVEEITRSEVRAALPARTTSRKFGA